MARLPTGRRSGRPQHVLPVEPRRIAQPAAAMTSSTLSVAIVSVNKWIARVRRRRILCLIVGLLRGGLWNSGVAQRRLRETICHRLPEATP